MEITKGMEVHYVHPNGTHSKATVTHVHNAETGVVDLDVARADGNGTYSRKTVAYREQPEAYSWHFKEQEYRSDRANVSSS